jgi:predicted nucleic acid-binding protein
LNVNSGSDRCSKKAKKSLSRKLPITKSGVNCLRRLDNLKQTLEYVSIQTETMLLAASLWAEVRQAGQPTADPKALDGDVILAAQARLLANDTTDVIIATTNVAHLSRFITALDWQAIG